MTLQPMHCCAYQEIANLSAHTSGREAMIEFCRLNWGTGKTNYHGLQAKGATLYSFYLFSAPIGGNWGREGYGKEFADFILENKLGQIIETPALTNFAFHADHKNQVWVWMPEHNAVAAWWEANRPTPKRNRKPAFSFASDASDEIIVMSNGPIVTVTGFESGVL